ncbi:hypothetical protein HZS_5526 [Henneguya salminicola]|nr:hypothetical protein HZS_5526 [Henneguya salminicola]
MSNISVDEEKKKEVRKKHKNKFSKENHSEIERRRRLSMNHYISQLADLFARGEASRKKLNKINVLKYAASYLQKLKEKEKIPQSHASLSFLNDDELQFMIFDAICGFELKINCETAVIMDVSDDVNYVLGCKKESLIGNSIFNIVYVDDLQKIEEQTNLHKIKSFQIFDFKRGLTIVETETIPEIIKNRKFILRLKCFNDENINNEYFCPQNKYTYKYHNFKFSKSCRLKYECGEYILMEFTALFKISGPNGQPYLHLVAYIVDDTKYLNDDTTFYQMSIQLSLDGVISYYEKNNDLFLGYKETEVLQRPFAAFVHVDDQSSFFEILQLAKTRKEKIIYFIKIKMMNRDGAYTSFKLQLKCICSVFSETPEFFNVFLEKDIPFIKNPEIILEKAEGDLLLDHSNSNLADPSLSPMIIKNISPRHSPPLHNTLLSIPHQILHSDIKQFEQEIPTMHPIFNVPAELSYKCQFPSVPTILPFNYIQTHDPIQNIQMFYPPQLNYNTYSYKNSFQGINNEGFDSTMNINTGIYTPDYSDCSYIQTVQDIPQTYFMRNTQQIYDPQTMVQNVKNPNIHQPQ